MISKDKFSEITESHPSLKQCQGKLQELIRDELEPEDTIEWTALATIQGSEGIVCMTGDNVYCFWIQKMFFFFKFPAIQTFHRRQIVQAESSNGNSVHLRAQADPNNPGEDYEENTLVFTSGSDQSDFLSRLN